MACKKTKAFLIFGGVISLLFVASSAGAASFNFTNANVKRAVLAPVVSGYTCPVSDTCVDEDKKKIIIGEADLYQQVAALPQKLVLVVFNGKMYSGLGSYADVSQGLLPVAIQELVLINSDGSQSPSNATLRYSLDLDTATMANAQFNLDGVNYTLVFTEKTFQIIWEPGTGNIETSPAGDIVKLSLRPQGSSTRTVPSTVEFLYNQIGGKDVDVTIDFGDGKTQKGGPVLAGLLNHRYENSGTYTASVVAKNSQGEVVASRSTTLTFKKESRFPSFEETGSEPFNEKLGLDPDNSWFTRCKTPSADGQTCIEEYRRLKTPGSLERIQTYQQAYMKYPGGQRFMALTSPKPYLDIAACVWDGNTQQCEGPSVEQELYPNGTFYWDVQKYAKGNTTYDPSFRTYAYTKTITGKAPLDIFFNPRASQMVLYSSQSIAFDLGNGTTFPYFGGWKRMVYDTPGTYYVKINTVPREPLPTCEDLSSKLSGVTPGSESYNLVMERRGCDGDQEKIYPEWYWYREPMESNIITIIVE